MLMNIRNVLTIKLIVGVFSKLRSINSRFPIAIMNKEMQDKSSCITGNCFDDLKIKREKRKKRNMMRMNQQYHSSWQTNRNVELADSNNNNL